MGKLNLKNLDARLFDSEVGHLDVESVEVDAIQTLVDSVGKLAFAGCLDASLIIQGTALVEDAE